MKMNRVFRAKPRTSAGGLTLPNEAQTANVQPAYSTVTRTDAARYPSAAVGAVILMKGTVVSATNGHTAKYHAIALTTVTTPATADARGCQYREPASNPAVKTTAQF